MVGRWWRFSAVTLALLAAMSFWTPIVDADDGGQSAGSTVAAMVSKVQDAQSTLSGGDIRRARSDGDAVELLWQEIEATVAQRFPQTESKVDEALDAANAALQANPPPSETAARLETLADALADLERDLQSGGATAPPAATPMSLARSTELLAAARASLARNDLAPARQSFDAFRQAWSSIEGRVRADSPPMYHQIESQMIAVTAALDAGQLKTAQETLDRMATELGALDRSQARYSAFDAAVTLLREGLEALLIIGALLALVTRAGRPDLRTQVWLGGAAGVVASLAVAVLLQVVMSRLTSGLNREVLEGVTGLGAALMLLYVSYWLHRQGSLADWRKFLATRTGEAITAGGSLILPSLAFLAVFREGAETILLYVGMAAAISLGDLLLGMAIGMVALAVLGVALFGFGLRLSLKPFFRTISVLLYYLAFKFVGTGIHAFQVAGVLPVTSADYLPSLDLIGVFPTWQTTVAQLLLVAGALAVVGWLAAGERSRRQAQTA